MNRSYGEADLPELLIQLWKSSTHLLAMIGECGEKISKVKINVDFVSTMLYYIVLVLFDSV